MENENVSSQNLITGESTDEEVDLFFPPNGVLVVLPFQVVGQMMLSHKPKR